MRSVNGTAIAVAIIMMIGAILLAMIGLSALGREPDQILYSVIGPLIVTGIGAVATLMKTASIESKLDDQGTKVDQIQHQTNGKLDARFKALFERLDEIDHKGNAPDQEAEGVRDDRAT